MPVHRREILNTLYRSRPLSPAVVHAVSPFFMLSLSLCQFPPIPSSPITLSPCLSLSFLAYFSHSSPVSRSFRLFSFLVAHSSFSSYALYLASLLALSFPLSGRHQKHGQFLCSMRIYASAKSKLSGANYATIKPLSSSQPWPHLSLKVRRMFWLPRPFSESKNGQMAMQ